MIEEAHPVEQELPLQQLYYFSQFFPHELYLQNVENNISKSWSPRQVINLWFPHTEEFKVLARKNCKSQLVLALYIHKFNQIHKQTHYGKTRYGTLNISPKSPSRGFWRWIL
jgi:hypothetical protein